MRQGNSRRPIAVVLVLVVLATTVLWARYSNAPRAPGPASATKVHSDATTTPNTAQSTMPGSRRTRDLSQPLRSWTDRFLNTSNYYSFIQESRSAALAGDARAQYYVGKALRNCSGTLGLYGKAKDPRAAFEQFLAERKYPPDFSNATREAMQSSERQAFDRCSRLFKEDPMNGLPGQPGGYPWQYWQALAVTNGDPLAQAAQAADQLGSIEYAAKDARERLQQSSAEWIQKAVASGDATAIMNVARIFQNPAVAASTDTGFALIIVACESGQDCSMKNEAIFGSCARTGQCSEGDSYTEILARGLGAAKYAAVYAQAQEIKDAIARGDATLLASKLKLRAPPT